MNSSLLNKLRPNKRPDFSNYRHLPAASLNSARCWVCNKKILVSFVPSRVRPVYCKEHLRLLRKGFIPAPKLKLIPSLVYKIDWLRHQRKVSWSLGTVGAMVIVALVFNSFFGKAAETQLYASSCLGGWQNPQLAQGEPDGRGEYSIENSAILTDSVSEIFCGNFIGEVPPDSAPTSVKLKLAWLVTQTRPIPQVPSVLESVDDLDESLIDESPNIPAENVEDDAIENYPPEEDAPTEESVIDNSGQSTDSPPSSDTVEPLPELPPTSTEEQPVSFWNSIIKAVFAQSAPVEDSVSEPVPVVDTQIDEVLLENQLDNIPEDLAADTEADDQVDALTEEIINENVPQEEIINAPEAISEVPVHSSFMEIRYTIDGINWNTLVEVNTSNWNTLDLDLPLNSWDDLSRVQVSFRSLNNFDAAPTVYLDAVWLNVEYDEFTVEDYSEEELEKLPRIELDRSKVFTNTKKDFQGSEEPRFELDQVEIEKATEIIVEPELDLPIINPENVFLPDTPEAQPNLFPEIKTLEPGELNTPGTINTNNPEPTSFQWVDYLNNGIGLVLKNTKSLVFDFTQWNRQLFVGQVAYAQSVRTRVLKSVITSPDRQEVGIVPVISEANGKLIINVPKPNNFTPGRWQIYLEILVNGKVVVTTSDFTWGVLAININKSILAPGEDAYLQIAALDADGHTLCDEPLELEITSPIGVKQLFTTTAGTIFNNSSCGADNVTDEPDYYLNYQVDEVGKYELKLVNTESNFQVVDSFLVQDGTPYIVERVAATRINPFKSAYTMRFKVSAVEDFSGQVQEQIPSVFSIASASIDYGLNSNSNSSDYSLFIMPAVDYHLLSWPVELNAGESVTLSYTYQAPEISPQFYLLGPLQISNSTEAGTEPEILQETRQWQIASDTTSGSTRFYLNSKDISEENATYNSMLPGTLPEGDTTSAAASSSGTFSSAPCEAGGFDQDTQAVPLASTNSTEYCGATFYSPILGASMQIDTGDTNSLSYNIYANISGTGNNCTTCVVRVRLYEYVESGSTFNLIDTADSTALTTSIVLKTITGTPDSSTTVDAGNRLVLVVNAFTGTTADSSNGTDNINLYFDRLTTAPSFLTMSYTLTTADKPDLTGSNDDEFNENTSCASNCDNTTIATSPTWTIQTSGNTTTEHVYMDASRSSQWVSITDVKTADLAQTTLANYTYMYQSFPTGDGDITTQISQSMTTDPATDPQNSQGLLIRYSSDTDFLILQAYQDGTATVVEVNNSGTLTTTTATITGYANNVMLRWSKSGTSYQAKYCNSAASDCTVSGNWSDLGTAITKSNPDQMGLASSIDWVTGTNSQSTASFEFFDSTVEQAVININGSCQAFDQSTNCGDLGTIKVAVGTSLQAQTDTGGGTGGTFSITGVAQPTANAIITVFVDGPGGNSDKAVAVTKYDGSGDIDGLLLYKEHLTIGSNDTGATFTSAELGTYDNSVSGDADIFFDYRTDWSNNNLTATGASVVGLQVDCQSPATSCTTFSTTEELYIQSGWTYRPDSGGSDVVATHDLENLGTFNVDANVVTINGSWLNSGTFTKTSGQTTTFISTGTGETINPGASSMANVTFNGSGGEWTATTNTFTVDEVLTITAGSFITGAVTNAVTGATSVTGTLTISSTTGTKTFTGDVTINSGGLWNETAAEDISFVGSLANNQTFTASTGVHTFSGASKTISGTSTVAIPNLTIDGTTTNNGTLTVSTALSGSSTLTQGADDTLNIGGTSGITGLTATASGNTVNYTGTAQTVHNNTYHHLGLSGSGAKTMTGITTVAGNFVMSGSATTSGMVVTTIGGNVDLSSTAQATTGANLAITGNLTVGSGTLFTVGAFTIGVTSTTSVTGTLAHSGTGTKTYTGAMTVNNTGSVTNAGNAAMTLGAGLTLNATSTWTKPSSATLTWSPTGTADWADNNGTKQDLGIISITGGASTPVVRLTTAVSATSVNVAAAHTLNANGSNTLTLTGASGSPLTLNGDNFTESTSTVVFNGDGDITIAATTYSNLTFSPTVVTIGKTYTAGGAVTVSGALDINPTAGSTLNLAFALGGTTAVTGSTTIRKQSSATSSLTTVASHSFTTGSLDIQAGGTFIGNASTLDSNGAVSIASGAALSSTSGTFNIAGNYSNSGTFTHNSGSVIFDGGAQQTLSGTMTSGSAFNNITITNVTGATPGDCTNTGFTASVIMGAAVTGNIFTITTNNVRVSYNTGSTYTFTDVNWAAADSNLIIFRNSVDSGTWILRVTNTPQVAVTYVNVARSDASAPGSEIDATGAGNVNCSNNSNWNFYTPSISYAISSSSLSLGNLNTAGVGTNNHTVTVTTNAVSGYVLYVTEDGNLRNGAFDIDDVGDSTVTAGVEEYGLNTANNDFSSDAAITGSLKIARSTGTAVTDEVTTCTYKAGVAPLTAAGNYSHIVTYVIVGNF